MHICNHTWNPYTGTSICISIPSYLFPKPMVKHECSSPHNVSSKACNHQIQYKCNYYNITPGNVTNSSDKLMTSKYIYYYWKIRDTVQSTINLKFLGIYTRELKSPINPPSFQVSLIKYDCCWNTAKFCWADC
jgi:hypothetical protein